MKEVNFADPSVKNLNCPLRRLVDHLALVNSSSVCAVDYKGIEGTARNLSPMLLLVGVLGPHHWQEAHGNFYDAPCTNYCTVNHKRPRHRNCTDEHLKGKGLESQDKLCLYLPR